MIDYRFATKVSPSQREAAILISGETSANMAGLEYVIESNEEGDQRVFKIHYSFHCSPFKEIRRIGDLLFVGHESHLYVFDVVKEENVLSMEMDGYFEGLYLHEDLVYVTGCHDLFCLNVRGEVLWKRDQLGIDGVIIDRFEGDLLWGSGEWDPPGGWRTFRCDRRSGEGFTWA